MQKNLRPVWAEIDLGNLKKNLEAVKMLTSPDTGILAIVKADSYGAGAVECSKAALQVPGVLGVAVATPDEAVKLRESGINGMTLVLGPVTAEASNVLADLGVSMTVTSIDGIKNADNAGKVMNKKAKIHIKIDTGMGRIGFQPDSTFDEVLDLILSCSNIDVEGVFSHFSSSDVSVEYTEYQIGQFKKALAKLDDANIRPRYKHLSNSAAVYNFPQAHFDLVRPGSMMYGYYPAPGVEEKAKLYPVLSLKARISYIKEVKAGAYIGYSRTYKAAEDTIIATLPLGFADGYPRKLSGKVSVLINGKKYPVAGLICMDQCMIDLKGNTDIKVGDLVTLIGTDGDQSITVYEIAEMVDTAVPEILTGISARVPRVYVES